MLHNPAPPARQAPPLITCERCGHPFLQRSIRAQRYCSDRCRVAAYRGAGRVTNEGVATPIATPLDKIAVRPRVIAETPGKSHSLHGRKQGGSIAGPPHVIAVEVVAGRAWRQVSSVDGVVCEVALLRPRGLVDPPGSAS